MSGFSMWDSIASMTLAATAQPPAGGFTANSVWDLVIKGGWIMFPLGLCSLVALTITVERLILLRRARVTPPHLLSAIPEMSRDPERWADRVGADTSPLAGVLSTAINARSEPREVQDRLIDEAGQRQVVRLRHRMRLLGSLPQVATMLGLLGTVAGMIRTFTVVAASGESLGKTERLAQGIYEAWTATAAGLVIAIPTIIAYQMTMGRIDRAAALLDQAAVDWRNQGRAPASSAPAVVVQDVRAPAPAGESRNGVVTAAV